MAISLLLIAPEPAAASLAAVLHRDLPAQVEVSASCRAGMQPLRQEDFDLILLDENLAAADPETTESLYAAAGATPILEMAFSICRAERVLRQVRSALFRRAQDRAKARAAAAAALGNELNASLTGVLLESQLALRQAGPELAPSLRHLIELASELRAQLQS